MKSIWIVLSLFIFVEGFGQRSKPIIYTQVGNPQNNLYLAAGRFAAYEDPMKGQNIAAYYQYYQPNFWVSLSYEHGGTGKRIYPSNFEFEVEVAIRGWHKNTPSTMPSDFNKTEKLKITFDPKQSSKNIYNAIYTPKSSESIYRLEVEVVSMQGYPTFAKDDISLHIVEGAEYVSQPLFSSHIWLNVSSHLTNTLEKTIYISNQNTQNFIGADAIDLEYTFIDHHSVFANKHRAVLETPSSSIVNYASLPLHELQFSRMTFPNHSVLLNSHRTLPYIHKQGFILYRVREVFYGLDGQRIEGKWFYPQTGNQIIKTINNPLEPNMNWQGEIQFAEEGKFKEVVNYFDGLNRNRQTVAMRPLSMQTIMANANYSVVSENYYDKEGRKAATLLPIPIQNLRYSPTYKSAFAIDATNKPYSHMNFYKENCMLLPDKIMGSANSYYSILNPNKNNSFNAFIPDADGYPIQISEFSNDNTDRLVRQGGVGATFQISSGRETKYYYGKASRAEINSLFGTDVGYQNFYFKNMVIDPNGQVSITYLDQNQRTIATSLSGEATETSIIKNTNNQGNKPIDYDLLEAHDFVKNVSKQKTSGVISHLVPGTQTVYFTVEVDSALYTENCKKPFCSQCYYDLTIRIKSHCNPLFSEVVERYNNYSISDSIPLICQNVFQKIRKDFQTKLIAGAYYISAEISIPDTFLDLYTKKFIDQGECIPTIDSFIRKHRKILEASEANCIKDCETCNKLYGDVDKTKARLRVKYAELFGVNTNQMDESTENMIDALAHSYANGCNDICTEESPCKKYQEMIIADMGPGGQYGLLYDTTNTHFWNTLENDDVLKNNISVIAAFENLKKRPGWRLGNLSIILQNPLALQRLRDQVIMYKEYVLQLAPTLDFNNQSDIDLMVNIWDKVININDFHPEWDYLMYCNENESHLNFIENELPKIKTWNDAILKGMFISGSSTIRIDIKDPFFKNKPSSIQIQFLQEIGSYSISSNSIPSIQSVSIAQLAAIMTSPKLWKFNETLKRFEVNLFYLDTAQCDGVKNMYWQNYVNLYTRFVRKTFENHRSATYPLVATKGIGACNTIFSHLKQHWLFKNVYKQLASNNPYCEKIARFINISNMEAGIQAELQSKTKASLELESLADFETECKKNCNSMSEGWIANLEACILKPGLTKTQLKNDLIKLCEATCGQTDQPFGASSLSDTKAGIAIAASNKICRSFEEIIYEYSNTSIASNAEHCSAFFIEFPKPHGVSFHAEDEITIERMTPCVCAHVEREAKWWHRSKQNISFYDYLKGKYPNDFNQFTANQLATIVSSCNNKDTICDFLPEEVQIPAFFACYPKANCGMILRAANSFFDKYPQYTNTYESLKTSLFSRRFFVGYMNHQLQINLPYDEYIKKIEQCKNCDTLFSDTVNIIEDCDRLASVYQDFEKERKNNGYRFAFSLHSERFYQFIDYVKYHFNFTTDYKTLISALNRCEVIEIPDCSKVSQFLGKYYNINLGQWAYSTFSNPMPLLDFSASVSYQQVLNGSNYNYHYSAEEYYHLNTLCDTAPFVLPLPEPLLTCKDFAYLGEMYRKETGLNAYPPKNQNEKEAFVRFVISQTHYYKLALNPHLDSIFKFCDTSMFGCAQSLISKWSPSQTVYFKNEQNVNIPFQNLCDTCQLNCNMIRDLISQYKFKYNLNINLQRPKVIELMQIHQWISTNYPKCQSITFREFLSRYSFCNCDYNYYSYSYFEENARTQRNIVGMNNYLSGSSLEQFLMQLGQDGVYKALMTPIGNNSATQNCDATNCHFVDTSQTQLQIYAQISRCMMQKNAMAGTNTSSYSSRVVQVFESEFCSTIDSMVIKNPSFLTIRNNYRSRSVSEKQSLYNQYVSYTQQVQNVSNPPLFYRSCISSFQIFDYLMGSFYSVCQGFDTFAPALPKKSCCETVLNLIHGHPTSSGIHFCNNMSNFGQCGLYLCHAMIASNQMTAVQYQRLKEQFTINLLHLLKSRNQEIDCRINDAFIEDLLKNCYQIQIQIVAPKPPRKKLFIKDIWGGNACNTIVSQPLAPRVALDTNACQERLEQLMLTNAINDWRLFVQGSSSDFRANYIDYCLSKANPKLKAKGEINEFQYTLYYYGQDGNLLRTVPPAGVNPITNQATLDKIEADRNNRIVNIPAHTLATDYKYNALNQVIEQTTPDAGITRFAYDQLGRLILSQNAQQQTESKYSYTLYDNLGRIYESGEIQCANNCMNSYFNQDFVMYSLYNATMVSIKPASTTKLRYITRTYYDQTKFTDPAPQFGGIQQNLRKRIASITLDTLDTDRNENTYHSALHYSYDVLGNVKTLVSENKILPTTMTNQRFKTLNYDYDLVSGKVNNVFYQKDQPDQFIYRYQYDADNRLTEAQTSQDGIYWQKDATYQYYLHGPLARTLIGEQEVQGIDYAYTLQGWLKSINASHLQHQTDMGQDGQGSTPNANTARDAVALSLRYFSGDYQQIGRTTQPIEATLPAAMNHLNLYNGNISSQVVSLRGLPQPTMAYQYRYDQLNRLVHMDAYQPQGTSFGMTTDYQERISYDPNGNILTYNRNKDGGVMMDKLTYKYHPTKKNQLQQVLDAVGDGVEANDIDNQTHTQNYKYDAIGNLIRDEQENMDIFWTPTGKISKIIQGKKKIMLTFAYYPMGNRVAKTVTDMTGKKAPFTTYYTRDAQGNTMAVYDNSSLKSDIAICELDRPYLEQISRNIITYKAKSLIAEEDDFYQNSINEYISQNWQGDSCKYKYMSLISEKNIPCFIEQEDYNIIEQLYYQDFGYFQSVETSERKSYLSQKYNEHYENMGDRTYCFIQELSIAMEQPIDAFEAWLMHQKRTDLRSKLDVFYTELAQTSIYYGILNDTAYQDSLYWKEQHLYGSSRLGIAKPELEVTNHTPSNASSLSTNFRNYELTNHLGNVLSTIKDEKKQVSLNGITVDYYEPIVITANDYYPFGMMMPNRSFSLAGSNYRFGFNTQEKDDEVYGKGNLMTAQYWEYDTRLGRRWNLDPKPQTSISDYAVMANNPVFNVDILGDKKSTHTDKEGNVVEVKDDGDLGVYKHKGNTQETILEISKLYTKDNTSAGGIKMGESLHSLSFSNQNIFNKKGIIEPGDIKINFGSKDLTERVKAIIGKDPNLLEYFGKAGGKGEWDIKSKVNDGSLLFGKYASPRDAGNFAAGAVAQKSISPEFAQFGYGAYNLSNNNKIKTAIITTTVFGVHSINPFIGKGIIEYISKFGEDRLSQRSIDIGKDFIKKQQ